MPHVGRMGKRADGRRGKGNECSAIDTKIYNREGKKSCPEKMERSLNIKPEK